MQVPLLDLAAERHALGAELDAAFARVLESGAFVGGPEVAGFEREFAAYLGVGHVVAVGNGTDALEIALQALGIGPGDAVLTVPFTFAATLEAIVRVGATPRLVDVRDDDLAIDAEAAAETLRRDPVRAILPVHLYGHPADLDALSRIARAHDALIVEDAAQAHGAWCTVAGERRRAGAVGAAACFSFYPTKNLGAMGDGGAIATGDDEVAARARLIANHGEAKKYDHVLPDGRNSRLDALQAAVLRLKLPRLDQSNAARRRAAARYAEGLAGLPLRLPVERPGSTGVYHQFVVRHPRRDRLRELLAERGVATAVHYPVALHLQPGFRRLGLPRGSFPVAERAAAEVLSLPLHPHLSDAAIEHVCASMREALAALG